MLLLSGGGGGGRIAVLKGVVGGFEVFFLVISGGNVSNKTEWALGEYLCFEALRKYRNWS